MRFLISLIIALIWATPQMEAAGAKAKDLPIKSKRLRKESSEMLRVDTVYLTDTIVLTQAPEALIIKIDSSYLLDDTLLNPLSYIDSSIDSLYMEWRDAGLLKTHERCIEMPDNQDIPDEVFLERIAALPNVIPCSYNKIVRRFIEMYLYQRPGQVSNMLAMSDYYFPIFEEVLERHQLPLELKYLPVIESGLNPNAVSKMGAAGLWQFMYSTGKMYGLQINSLTDERRDPVKSTEAAAKFLKSLYDMFGDWNLAIAAYNCGPGNVRKAIARSGYSKDFWKIYYHLPRETRSYVPIFIAANYVMVYHAEHGICPAEVEFPLVCDTFMIEENMHFKQIATVCDIPMNDIKKLNPHFRSEIAHGSEKTAGVLYLPSQYTTRFIQWQDSIPNYKKKELLNDKLTAKPYNPYRANGEAVVYRVRSGDNLYNIARKYGVSVSKIKSWNNLKSDMLQIGQRLIIY